MYRHVALWRFDDEDDEGHYRETAIQVKAGFEEMAYEVHGIVSVDVCIDPLRLAECDADICLECLFEDRDAFQDFLDHPRRRALLDLVEACTDRCLSMDFKAEEPEIL